MDEDHGQWSAWGLVGHAQALHSRAKGPAGGGTVIVARAADGWNEFPVRVNEMACSIASLAGTRDAYITYNRFWGRRRLVAQLRALDALFVDLDTYKLPADDPLVAMSPEDAASEVIRAVSAMGVPKPSIVTFTGRGLSLCWTIDPIPAQALPRWRACQKHLMMMLVPYGADPTAIDATRLTRLDGTINSKSGLPVGVLEDMSSKVVFDFDTLANALLPVPREEIRAAKPKQKKERSKHKGIVRPEHNYDISTLHLTRMADLMKLAKGRWGSQVPPGQRNTWMFFVACSLAWATRPEELQRRMVEIGRDMVDWSATETMGCISSLLDAARRDASDGGRRRYRYKDETIIAGLGICEAEMRALGLRCLVTDKVRRERDASRKRRQRRSEGVKPRETYLSNVLERRQRAVDLQVRGLTATQIGSVMGASADAIRKLLQRAKAAGVAPSADLRPVVLNTGGTPPPPRVDTSVQVYDGEPLPTAGGPRPANRA